LFAVLFLTSCIGEDIIDDTVEERLVAGNPINTLGVNRFHNLDVRYFNSVGQREGRLITYTSSDPEVATVNSAGVLAGRSEGETTITYSVTTAEDRLSESFLLTVVNDAVDESVTEKSGTIITTSSYLLEGEFVLSKVEGSEDILLSIDESYRASTALPGLYLYLTNNPFTPNGALEIGPVEVFSGAHEYTIPNTGLNDYNYLLYWCKPFVVKVGEGEILNPSE
jgi:hypothetical protein